MSTHSPLPWKEVRGIIYDAEDKPVADLNVCNSFITIGANAAFILALAAAVATPAPAKPKATRPRRAPIAQPEGIKQPLKIVVPEPVVSPPAEVVTTTQSDEPVNAGFIDCTDYACKRGDKAGAERLQAAWNALPRRTFLRQYAPGSQVEYTDRPGRRITVKDEQAAVELICAAHVGKPAMPVDEFHELLNTTLKYEVDTNLLYDILERAGFVPCGAHGTKVYQHRKKRASKPLLSKQPTLPDDLPGDQRDGWRFGRPA